MMNDGNGLPSDYIAIDTNVFGKIANKDGRIRALPHFLMGNKVRPLILL